MMVSYSALARADLQSIVDYLEPRSPTGVRSILRRIEATIALLQRHPSAGRRLRKRVDVRAIPVGRYPYRIYYRPESDVILILHIRHISRRSPRLRELG